jgi:hypothetical protein
MAQHLYSGAKVNDFKVKLWSKRDLLCKCSWDVRPRQRPSFILNWTCIGPQGVRFVSVSWEINLH